MNSGTVNKYQVPIWRAVIVIYGLIIMVVGRDCVSFGEFAGFARTGIREPGD